VAANQEQVTVADSLASRHFATKDKPIKNRDAARILPIENASVRMKDTDDNPVSKKNSTDWESTACDKTLDAAQRRTSSSQNKTPHPAVWVAAIALRRATTKRKIHREDCALEPCP